MDGSNMFPFRSLDVFDCYLPEIVTADREVRKVDKYVLGKPVSSSTLHLLLRRPLLPSSRLPSLALFVLQGLEYRSSLVVPLKKEK